MAIYIKTDNGTEIMYKGCVLDLRERNYYDDSDFYAIVWDEEKQIIKDIEYATTRFPSDGSYAEIDATKEVIQKAEKYMENRYFDEWKKWNKQQAETVEKEKTVKVVKGRKVPIGTIGKVFFIKTMYFGYKGYQTAIKIGLLDKDGNKHYTYIDNVEVVNPEQYELPEDEGRAVAKRKTKCHYWYDAIYLPKGFIR